MRFKTNKEKGNILSRVQVKSTGCIGKGGNYQVALKSCGGTKVNNVSTLSLCDNY